MIDQQPDAPLVIRNPKFSSHWSWKHGIITALNYDVVNVSQKTIHSFMQSLHSGESGGIEASSSQPESALRPGESMHTGISVSGKNRVALKVDFVQFADGTTWYLGSGQEIFRPDSVRAGTRAAADHMLRLLESAGPAATLAALPRIRADLKDHMVTSNVG